MIHVPGIRIAGVACAVPSHVVENADPRIIKGVGVRERRHTQEGCDGLLMMAEQASHRAMNDLGWKGIDALVFVTQTSPRRMPSIACELQHTLGLSKSVPAFDLNMACSGYVYGLWVAASLRLPRVLLVVGDTISQFLDMDDTATAPIFGDAVSATLLERDDKPGGITFIGGTDGEGSEALTIEGGEFADSLGNIDTMIRRREILEMDGLAVFNFALSTVPGLVEATTMNSHCDWYLFHQANRMMLEHIAKKAKVPAERMPMNLERYGNTSSASIPLLMCDSECTEALRTKRNRCAMFGFGAGLSYGGILTDVGPIPLSLTEV